MFVLILNTPKLWGKGLLECPLANCIYPLDVWIFIPFVVLPRNMLIPVVRFYVVFDVVSYFHQVYANFLCVGDIQQFLSFPSSFLLMGIILFLRFSSEIIWISYFRKFFKDFKMTSFRDVLLRILVLEFLLCFRVYICWSTFKFNKILSRISPFSNTFNIKYLGG